MIRITGGHLRGRQLKGELPAGVRPTAGRTREALFSMVGQDLEGWSMLDLFGGSGLIAIEAASRGAAPVHICEQNGKVIRYLRAQLDSLGVQAKVWEGDALRLPLPTVDFVFADPPYDNDRKNWLPRAASLTERLLVAEGRHGGTWPEEVGSLKLDRVRSYGEAELALYVGAGAEASETEMAIVGDDLGVIKDDR
ncbi:MAG TPA: RsmD family RNA methyltransferase [Myxococcota bacterium]|nr:RsmD family RNA methyltransferase [Myxococcota bacterium]HNH46403.1 RsmD family RNA methyltransferase [Myxococcota bacterium]